jgi:hypothetical protein
MKTSVVAAVASALTMQLLLVPLDHSAGSWLRSLKNEQLVRSAAFHS